MYAFSQYVTAFAGACVLDTHHHHRCIHQQSVRVTKKMITRARHDNRVWGAGLRPPPSRLTERHVITKETFNHLRDWIFSTDLLELLKASEQSTQRGHCFAVKEAASTTFPRYQQSADNKGVDAVTERVYRRVLSQRVFTKYRKDHCMCTTCLRSGWRGIFDNGNKVIKAMGLAGSGLSARLKRLWEFIRLQLHLHFEEESGIAAHCTRLHLGSLAEPRFNEPCIHKHPNPTEHPPPREVRLQQTQPLVNCLQHKTIRTQMGQLLGHSARIAMSSTCTQCRKDWSQEWTESAWYGATPPSKCATREGVCCLDTCGKRSTCHCDYCDKSLCRKHCEDELCSAEIMPNTFGTNFVCTACAPKVDSCQHASTGCGTCDEIHYFKLDLMKCVNASGVEENIGRAKDVCHAIDTMVGHTARINNQERYWPDLLEELKTNLDYKQVIHILYLFYFVYSNSDVTQVLLKSDYWKKFEGTAMKQEKCKSAPKQSIETHSAWYLIPPANAEDVDWDFFPEDIEFALPDETGFRGFIVEFYNVISGQ